MPPEILEMSAPEAAVDGSERVGEEIRIANEIIETRNHLYHLPGKMAEVHDRLQEIIWELQGKYPDFKQVYLFHVISGSSANRAECSRFDFPGDDSIVKIGFVAQISFKGAKRP